ncbi:hypothetical protein KGM_209318 [Danaus plexippus plexippus]|uniref:Uncharacterized protein n=1 Tax=Danaus plexippus plexippus TaxID=278856 RepID=A0A212F1H7_DANPL|nr:hypothetical protein KGM_209318 [Danaus plexippus plexippus]
MNRYNVYMENLKRSRNVALGLLDDTKDIIEGGSGESPVTNIRLSSPNGDVKALSAPSSSRPDKRPAEYVKYGKITFNTTAILHHYPQRQSDHCSVHAAKNRADSKQTSDEVEPDNNNEVQSDSRRTEVDVKKTKLNDNNNDTTKMKREITQITRKAFCYHKWPKFELCTEVSFGVPLVYDEARRENMTEEERNRFSEHDLTDMWTSYSQRDPFAARLRNLGIAEYQIPDDKGVLALWLVVAAGVVISAALLALALWRFSCFEDYTRMPVYGDTDSLNEKRTLDLYPTPHQTLPPLFETDYKWSEDFHGNKVDAGFANSSFLSDGVFDPRAERPAARDRNYSFSPRDVYDI